MSVPLTPSADKNWITARWACLEESMARSLTVISLLFQSTTHCRYRVYQISPDIHCHAPEKSQSSTAGNNGAPTSVPLSLGHALYIICPLHSVWGWMCQSGCAAQSGHLAVQTRKVRSNYETRAWNLLIQILRCERMILISGEHKFSKNLGGTSKF